MKHKLEAGTEKLWKSDKLSCEKPYTLDCVFCVGWGPNESVGAFFYGNRICVQDFTHILQSVNHNWDNNVTRWYNQWEWDCNSHVNATYYDVNLKHVFNLNGGPTQYCYFHRVSWNLTPMTNEGCVYWLNYHNLRLTKLKLSLSVLWRHIEGAEV